LAVYQRAAALKPSSIDIHDNLGLTYQALNQLDLAEDAFRKTIQLSGQIIADEEARFVDEAEYGSHHWHLALLQLLKGDYKQGFARYRSRICAVKGLARPVMPMPLWKGEDIRGRSLLVCDEQGYGDTLMLARWLPLLRAQGIKIYFQVSQPLLPLFQGWDGIDYLVGKQETLPPCDYFCSSFDLPFCCGATLADLPQQVPYISLSPPDAASRLVSARPKIGVVWGGSPRHKHDAKRSISLAVFAKVFDGVDVDFYNFTRDLKTGDADLLPHYPLHNLVPDIPDFAAAARFMGQMDLLISCDTAMVHLAGALGKKVWVLLPFSPDWRWLIGRDDSPWYPTARLFRQQAAGDWGGVVEEVTSALQQEFHPAK